MAARFSDAAVDALADYLETNFATYLRAVETELSLSANDLPDPAAYVRADLPWDNRNPRVDVFEESWDLEDDQDDIIADIDCAVVWSYLGDADREAGELLARRCHVALVKAIYADRQLNNTVRAVYLGSGSSGSVAEDEQTRHAYKQTVTVSLHEVL